MPNGLELSRSASQASLDPFSTISAGKTRPNSPHASRVGFSELFGGAGVTRSNRTPFRLLEQAQACWFRGLSAKRA